MRRLAILLLSAVAFSGFSTGADAADVGPVVKARPIVKAPPPLPPATSDGTGFYVGINGGYDWGRVVFSDPTGTSGMRLRSGLIGLTVGYNAQSGSLVYGAEADIDYAWLGNTNWTVAPCFGCEVRLRYFGTARGRLGYTVGSALPFVTGGLAYGGVRTGMPLAFISQEETKAGWTVGAGVEYAIMGAWSVKAEYLYFELERTTCTIFTCGTPVDVKVRGNLVRVGGNYRF